MRPDWLALLRYMRTVAERSPPRPTRVEVVDSVVMWFDALTGELVTARTVSGVMRQFVALRSDSTGSPGE